jgi:hypothetical protein
MAQECGPTTPARALRASTCRSGSGASRTTRWAGGYPAVTAHSLRLFYYIAVTGDLALGTVDERPSPATAG